MIDEIESRKESCGMVAYLILKPNVAEPK
jgi:hypothetical protein